MKETRPHTTYGLKKITKVRLKGNDYDEFLCQLLTMERIEFQDIPHIQP